MDSHLRGTSTTTTASQTNMISQTTTFATSILPAVATQAVQALLSTAADPNDKMTLHVKRNESTVNGVVIGLLSSFGSAILIALIFLVVYFFRYTTSGRIFLDRIGRPGEYDDEQQYLREEAEALEEMDDLQRTEYLRAKGTFLYYYILWVCGKGG